MKRLINKIGIGVLLFGFISCNTPNKTGAESAALTPETEQLKELLRTVHEHGYMFGHQDATVYGIGWNGDADRSDVKSVCGDYPAVCGWDIGHIELGRTANLDSVFFDRMKQEIVQNHLRGGINTISWHLDNPYTGGSSWDTSAKDSVVASILPDGKEHPKFTAWLDTLVTFFGSLTTEDGTKIPILFRPWHEHTGSWFWWGKDHCTTEQYKELWVMTHSYLKLKGVNNILYAYSPGGGASAEEYMERYPGDEYVDLLGFDYYQLNGTAGTQSYKDVMDSTLVFLTKYGKEHDKPIAVTETGFETIPDATWWTSVFAPIMDKHPIAYVLVWRNAREKPNHYYAPYPEQVSAEDFVQFYKQPKSLFAKDIEKLKKPEQ